MLDRLLHDHDKLRNLSREMTAILVGPLPSEMERFAELRWAMASTIMSHLAFEDRAFYSKLEAHPYPETRAMAARFRAELVERFEAYSEHGKQWSRERIQADWDGYRGAALQFLRWLVERARREEVELYPLIRAGAVEVATRNLVPANWAKDAFVLKDQIGAR